MEKAKKVFLNVIFVLAALFILFMLGTGFLILNTLNSHSADVWDFVISYSAGGIFWIAIMSAWISEKRNLKKKNPA